MNPHAQAIGFVVFVGLIWIIAETIAAYRDRRPRHTHLGPALTDAHLPVIPTNDTPIYNATLHDLMQAED